ncbi:MAG: hypothetical protein IKT68_00395 [Clostridia bacterium]|nr:hypothetical protein [Clostridia bacterium]
MNQTLFEELKRQQPQFFLGANSGEGFYNCFQEIYNPNIGDRLYIIKGGPGMGKSSFMKRMSLFMASLDQPCELFFCSSDPTSLDGVRFPTIRTSFVDGTAPHSMEPSCLGVSERLIDLSRFLDYDAVEKHREEILPLSRQKALLHKRASRYMAAARGLLDDNFVIDCEYTDFNKINDTVDKLCKTYLKNKYNTVGHETKYFLSGISASGTLVFEETLLKMVNRIVAVEDEYGATSSVVMSTIRKTALDAGYNIIVCPCAISPGHKIDHVIIPQADIAFCTVNSMLPITLDNQRRIHARRFRDSEQISERRQRLRFNRRAAEELMEGAGRYIFEANQAHSRLETFYVKSMDFEGVNRLAQSVENELLSRIDQST